MVELGDRSLGFNTVFKNVSLKKSRTIFLWEEGLPPRPRQHLVIQNQGLISQATSLWEMPRVWAHSPPASSKDFTSVDSTNHRPKVLRKLHKAKRECSCVQGWAGANTPPRTQQGARAASCFGACGAPGTPREAGKTVGSSWHCIPESTGFVEDILVG